MNLDKLASIPAIDRLMSDEPKEGYYWDEDWQAYFEGDDLFRLRVKCVAAGLPAMAYKP